MAALNENAESQWALRGKTTKIQRGYGAKFWMDEHLFSCPGLEFLEGRLLFPRLAGLGPASNPVCN